MSLRDVCREVHNRGNFTPYEYSIEVLPNPDLDYQKIDLRASFKSEGIDIGFLRSTVDFDDDTKYLFPRLIPLKTRKALGNYASQFSNDTYPQMKAYIYGRSTTMD